MAIILKGIEIDNFKSYTEKQYIHFSDLSVLLGANSSGKSTALQALLIMKQTIECNSPDEELLLSGKYVALGDFDDVISDPKKDYFTLAVVLGETEKSENIVDDDEFKILWRFERADDGISAKLMRLDIMYENLELSFKRSTDNLYNMYINGKRNPFSAKIYNLVMKKYVIHYDLELNNTVAELLNDVSKTFLPKKTTTVQNNEPICINEIERFYFRLMDRVQESDDRKGFSSITVKEQKIAKRLSTLIDTFGELQVPRYEAVSRILPKDLRIKILELALSSVDKEKHIEMLISKYEKYICEYEKRDYCVENFQGKYELGRDPFQMFDRDSNKEDYFTQLKLALDFYKDFLQNFISDF